MAPVRKASGEGAYHGAEIVYVFGEMANATKFDAKDRELSNMMMKAWVNFAATGNPNGVDVPYWPAAYNGTEGAYLNFGDKIEVKKDDPKKIIQDFERIFSVE